MGRRKKDTHFRTLSYYFGIAKDFKDQVHALHDPEGKDNIKIGQNPQLPFGLQRVASSSQSQLSVSTGPIA